MKKENYLNFAALRKALYDAQLSERARLVYIHLLQKSSIKGCNPNALYNVVELTKPQIAIDLGILTKKGEPANKSIQRALEELEVLGYLKRYQKYKSEGCPLTIMLNFKKEFLNKKIESEDKNEFNFDEIEDKKESDFVKTDEKFVHPYNPFLSINNPSLSINNINNNILEENTNKENNIEIENNNIIEEKNKILKLSKITTFEEFKEEVDIIFNKVSTETEAINEKGIIQGVLSKIRLQLPQTLFNRCSMYINRRFQEKKEELEYEYTSSVEKLP